MRRNLRLDWRALALLGALLSIIIDWPVLVYAMPIILPPVTAKASTEAAVTTVSLINIIKNDTDINFLAIPTMAPYQDDDYRDDHYGKLNEFTRVHSKSAITKERTNKYDKALNRHLRLTREEEDQEQQQLAVNDNYNSISHQQNISLTKEEDHERTVIHNQIPQNSHEVEEADEETNTHIENSTNVQGIDITSTTESSGKVQSTLMPPLLTEQDNETQESKSSLSAFQFLSSNHMAILSRTERSIRSSSSSSSLVNDSNGRGVMVRRSSDINMGNTKTKRLNNSRNLHHKSNLDRNERSTVSHLSGPSRKIQLYIKNRFIQLLPDGTVNGTQDTQCEYTILQRSTVEVGRIKIQGVATCLYLCMDPCGAVYGSQEFTDDCVFNESMEQHNYNTYSSTYNSNWRRKYYLALNGRGEPRKLQIPPNKSLGKLDSYANAITEPVPQERVEQLIAKNFGANRIKHGIRQLCDTGKPLIELIDSKNFKALPKCNPNSRSSSNINRNSNSNSNSFSSNRNTNSNSSLNIEGSLVDNSNSNNGQLLNNVPAANDKSKLSNCSRSSSSNSKPETNSNSSSQSSISNSQNNGHISNSNSSSSSCLTNNSNSINSNSNSPTTTTTTTTNSKPLASDHRGGSGKKKNKKRKCRPSENEEEHNCKTSLKRPQSLKMGPKRCRELKQQLEAGLIDIKMPPICNKKLAPKKQKLNKKPTNEPKGNKNGLGTDGLGPNNRRGKKLNINNGGGGGAGVERQAAKLNQNINGGQKKNKNKPKRGGGGGGGNNNNKKKQKSTTSTTEQTSSSSSSSSTSTLRPKFWETTSLLPSTTLYDSYDPQAETTSDRGDREQRNVRYSNSMEESREQSSEDTSAAEEQDEDESELDLNNEDQEEASYEDDTFVASSSGAHLPYGAADSAHTSLTGGADDFLYYDQLDS